MKSQLIKKLVRRSGYVVLALVALLALFILEEHLRGRIMLARYKAELRAKGEKLTLEELDLPPLPTNENGAPAVLEAASELGAMVQSNEYQIRDLVKAEYTLPGKVIVWHRKEHIPEAHFWEWRGVDQKAKYVTQKLDWDGLATEIASMQATVGKVKRALQQPVFRAEVDYHKISDVGMQLYTVENLERWLAITTLSALHGGDRVAALDSIATLARLASRPLDERLMRSQDARAQIAEIGLQVTWEALQDDGWSEEQLLQMQQAWQSVDLISSLPKTADVQRAIDLTTWESDARREYFMEMILRREDDLWRRFSGSVAWRVRELAWKSQDELQFLQKQQLRSDFLKRLSVPIVAYAPYRKLLDLDRGGRSSLYDRLRYWSSRMFFPRGDVETIMICETERQMTLAAIAIRRYQNSTGHSPSSLIVLVPAYLPSPPRDYMDGNPLRYQLNPDGTWTLYSVGVDGVDDGGDPNPPAGGYIGHMWQGRDLVWPQAASER